MKQLLHSTSSIGEEYMEWNLAVDTYLEGITQLYTFDEVL